jgi:cytidine deaminase
VKKFDHNITYTVFESLSELPENIARQFKILSEKVKDAYAPYSDFKVAAAVNLDNDKWVYGTNQENAAYPSGLCAERVALFYAKSQYPEARIKSLLIITEKSFEIPCSPCGACRQVISEYELNQPEPVSLYLYSQGQIWYFHSATSLLPFVFTAENLKK